MRSYGKSRDVSREEGGERGRQERAKRESKTTCTRLSRDCHANVTTRHDPPLAGALRRHNFFLPLIHLRRHTLQRTKTTREQYRLCFNLTCYVRCAEDPDRTCMGGVSLFSLLGENTHEQQQACVALRHKPKDMSIQGTYLKTSPTKNM